ncbi:MAG: methyl-accepting chemotaxis protein [Lachnospiraceae bacterium]|nr:methyl-accepting chemotaxis protein [Lachnospiraceae bacterium]
MKNANNTSNTKKRRSSIRTMIMVPVMVLGIVSIISNIMAIRNINNVNNNASEIADVHMSEITKLAAIQEKTQNIHKLALSHIIATDFDTMIGIVGDIEAKETEVEENLKDYAPYVSEEDVDNYNTLIKNYKSFKKAIVNLMAYSAKGDTAGAYACANGDVADGGTAMQTAMDNMSVNINAAAQESRDQLSAVYATALTTNIITIMISIISIIGASVIVMRHVIRPVKKVAKELSVIISDIDRREGDLTKRVTVKSNDEIGALGRGINTFMEKLQNIFNTITKNSTRMDIVVSEVLGSVHTSNDSASDLSALTEELAATMQEVANNAATINGNAESVSQEVQHIAMKSNEINDYSKNMKQHADNMENTARINMEQISQKVNEILDVLNYAIEESSSVDQVNSLTNEILSISSQTNLLALNASIEAARAGEAGKGFAVVAGEISNLADSSRDTANNIQQINTVVTNAVHNLAENANNLVSYMTESILPQFESFVTAGGEYRDNATYIEATMNEFNEKTDELKSVVAEIASSIQSITSAIEEGVRGVTGAAESTQVLVEDMDNITRRMDENKEIAGDLQQEATIFKKL